MSHPALILLLGLLVAPAVEDCPDLSGRWLVSAQGACDPYVGVDGGLALELPAHTGYMLPGLPAVVEIEQDDCLSVAFRVLENDAGHPRHDFAGQGELFELAPSETRAVTWRDSGLTVRQRIRKQGGAIFPGFSRAWAEWSLDLESPDRVVYRYSFVEKGATLFVFPFENASTSTCTWQRVAE